MVCGDTANEDRQPQVAPQVHGDTANEDGQPQVAPQVCGDTANEDGQPQAAPQVSRQRGNEDRQPQAPQQQRIDAPTWIWNDTLPGGNYRPLDTPFTGNTGLTCPMNENPEPADFFKLYFTDEIYDLICRETSWVVTLVVTLVIL